VRHGRVPLGVGVNHRRVLRRRGGICLRLETRCDGTAAGGQQQHRQESSKGRRDRAHGRCLAARPAIHFEIGDGRYCATTSTFTSPPTSRFCPSSPSVASWIDGVVLAGRALYERRRVERRIRAARHDVGARGTDRVNATGSGSGGEGSPRSGPPPSLSFADVPTSSWCSKPARPRSRREPRACPRPRRQSRSTAGAAGQCPRVAASPLCCAPHVCCASWQRPGPS